MYLHCFDISLKQIIQAFKRDGVIQWTAFYVLRLKLLNVRQKTSKGLLKAPVEYKIRRLHDVLHCRFRSEIDLLGSLSNNVFERRTSTGSGLFSFFDGAFAQIFSQIASIIVKKLRNTNFISSRHVKRENTSLPVDVRRSKTSLLKLPIVAPSIFSRLLTNCKEIIRTSRKKKESESRKRLRETLT